MRLRCWGIVALQWNVTVANVMYPTSKLHVTTGNRDIDRPNPNRKYQGLWLAIAKLDYSKEHLQPTKFTIEPINQHTITSCLTVVNNHNFKDGFHAQGCHLRHLHEGWASVSASCSRVTSSYRFWNKNAECQRLINYRSVPLH